MPCYPAEMGRNSTRSDIEWRFLAPVMALVTIAFLATAWIKSGAPITTVAQGAGAPVHVGSQACAGCHASQAASWAASHHAHAMDHARPETMRGDFAGRSAEAAGIRARFFREGGAYLVETAGSDGKQAVFTISHSLGWEPLQQYLVTFPDGRIQTLPWAWDTRPATEGGQRWFLVYGDEQIGPADSRYWTRLQQNWNHMCAECHTTDLRKGYDAQADSFRTRWSELGVGCEGCHGAGSGHIAWARAGADGGNATRGFAALAHRRPAPDWSPDPGTGSPAAGVARPPGDEVETCARCHSRRGQIGTDWRPGQPIAQTHSPVTLAAGLFEDDGQMKDEVFNDHAFKQSLMYAKGVVCSDCHEPHSGKVRAEGAAICAQCHQPERFAAIGHTGHAPGPGAPDCIGCHMPARTYMQVDRRHDHSFRTPRPDLSAALGVPNTCSACHADKPANWAAAAVERWHGPQRKGFQTYADAFHRSRTGDPSSRDTLQRLATDNLVPAPARATAVEELASWPAAASERAVTRALDDPDPVVRATALRHLEGQPAERRRIALPLLADPVRLVRIAAGYLLADLSFETLPQHQREALSAAIAEFEAALAVDLDRPEARANRALLRLKQQRPADAESEYLAALRLDPAAAAIAAQLADLYRRTGHETDAERVLRAVLAVDPGSAGARHALGLSLIRQKRPREALIDLKAAAEADPANARFAFIYAVALRSLGQPELASRLLAAAATRHPADVDILSALLQEALQRQDRTQALDLARRLAALRPDDPRFKDLAGRLGR
ncbi:tetratricopeptide repeat protein [Bosea sp. (in: a-proteobacteria)]|uniref:tetratricopeptide repeat protein n=1 Tax=Bosea sp. (in: a-proteobacteria) TaxID=1871050 RepID=UPI0025BBD946|nr:tetratricopeptide repeat protein [Bosea sp. (in: a-proteobacteria)]